MHGGVCTVTQIYSHFTMCLKLLCSCSELTNELMEAAMHGAPVPWGHTPGPCSSYCWCVRGHTSLAA